MPSRQLTLSSVFLLFLCSKNGMLNEDFSCCLLQIDVCWRFSEDHHVLVEWICDVWLLQSRMVVLANGGPL